MVTHFLKSFFGISVFFVILFLAAGKLFYAQGWIFFAVSMFGLGVNTAGMYRELAEERERPGSGTAPWDRTILGLSAVMALAAYAAAGLDSGRFGWSGGFNLPMTVAGIGFTVAGQVLFAVAKYQNTFFSSVVRIQKDRGHRVFDTGLYRVVRHPGYLGMMLCWIGFPLILNSLYCAVPVLAAMILLVLRTGLEDALFSRELEGYREYRRTTRYRLVPFVW